MVSKAGHSLLLVLGGYLAGEAAGEEAASEPSFWLFNCTSELWTPVHCAVKPAECPAALAQHSAVAYSMEPPFAVSEASSQVEQGVLVYGGKLTANSNQADSLCVICVVSSRVPTVCYRFFSSGLGLA